MQVANSTQLASSATLGGANQTINFGISDDPAFFQILSANLYSNQKLAVVRETLCNSWDAHIEAGLKDTAVKVSISEEGDLIFRDFGTGIPHDKMGEVYGTYGASTKKTNSNVTGGFGLGCKSPFAYTDSFRVISYNQGTKTVYNITKSSVESGGRPGITKIMDAPTTETGLEVRIHVEDGDVHEFLQYIRYITLHGEMKVDLEVSGYYHGATGRLDRLGMSFEPGSYHMDLNIWYDGYMGRHDVFIRYGNVIYPALDTPATHPALETIRRFMRIVNIRRILVQAAPDTLALTPGREALSSQKLTENGIVDICVNLTKRVEQDIRASIPVTAMKVGQELRNKPTIFYQDTNWYDFTRGFSDLQQRYLRSPLGKDLVEHWRKYFKNCEMAAYKQFTSNCGLHPSIESALLNALNVAKNNNRNDTLRRFHYQFVWKPVAKVFEHKDLDLKSLHVIQFKGYRSLAARNFHLYPKNMEILSNFYYLTERVVFITTRLKEIEYSCAQWPGFKGSDFRKNYYIYHISMKKDAKVAPIKAFTDAGWTVVDLTLNHEWDPDEKHKKRGKKLAKAKPVIANGLVPIRNMVDTDDKGVMVFTRSKIKTAKEWQGNTDAPLFYVKYDDVKHNKLGRFCTPSMLDDNLLDNAVVVRNGIERNMAVRRGAVPVDQYFIKPLLKIYLSKEMKTYLTKERQSDLANVHKIESDTLRMLEKLDIKVPGLKKLIFRKDLETIISAINECFLSRLYIEEVLTEEEYEQCKVVEALRLTKFAWIKQIKAVESDIVIRRLTIKQIHEIADMYPERKAALRSLVLIAMKNGNKK
jgi:hypothetical protein